MELLFLTKTGGILGPFATVLGWIINYIYKFLEMIGIPNIGLAIILFTLIVNIILLPLTLKQQKFTKLSAVMNPEIQKIQEKYKGKKDEVSMRRMQAETQAVYQKYGASTMGGCLYMIIQLPILFALYRVIYNIPAYVDSVYALYEPMANGILNFSDGMNQANALITELEMRVTQFTSDTFTTNRIIDMLYNLKTSDWTAVQNVFGTGIIQQSAVDEIIQINSFIGGLNISDPPTANGWWPGILIPILSGVTQWLSLKITSAQTNTVAATGNNKDNPNPMGNSMKMMNTIMPLFSVFLCFSVQIGLGIYWIASAVFRTLISVFINKYLDKEGVDVIIEKNREKAKKKAEKRGDKPSRFEEYAKQSTRNIEMAQAAKKRKSISELASTSVEGKSQESGKKKDSSGKNTENENKTTNLVTKAPVKKDDSSEDKNSKAGKKGSSGNGSIAAYANMLKKK
ncbi:YidC/Oxa1 family membrane protein insertase [Catenibacillus scindens]|uniref:YidC/Oxa1 family membrane protein insertase n=1 Tax=Catenibacillus scindens TaxID=673271 RepID=A0A7W8HBP5_9FIRM|nr:YidC/Oxa1 family membrane protein insertase [Catenibacillus scindens]MBB5265531.1 YidC/Oxa1 family membrane protein insertase [Catenibacillus scindens]